MGSYVLNGSEIFSYPLPHFPLFTIRQIGTQFEDSFHAFARAISKIDVDVVGFSNGGSTTRFLTFLKTEF